MFKKIFKSRKVDNKKIMVEKLIPVESVLLDYLYALYEETTKDATFSGKEIDCLKMKHRYEIYTKTLKLFETLKNNIWKK